MGAQREKETGAQARLKARGPRRRWARPAAETIAPAAAVVVTARPGRLRPLGARRLARRGRVPPRAHDESYESRTPAVDSNDFERRTK